jgi:Ca2+-binding EF-hand superfamily protein
LKSLIRNRSKDIEDEFKRIDRGSYGELTQDLLYDLFKGLSLEPPITRSEVDLIWSRCHLKRDGNLDFYQFLREFGYSKHSAHYPNAKHNPPKKGDADFILTSNSLYGDSVLIHGAVLNVIRSKWDELRREFTELDPYRTGYVQSDEFNDVLSELWSSINEEELDMLKYRFQTKNDSR